jgi:putative FmdB family regulatory protein
MPFYEFRCPACDTTFDIRLAVSDRDNPQPCKGCGATASRQITAPMFNLPGDDWPGKASRVAKQMERKNQRLGAKQNERKRDAPMVTLAPNVGGERVESWAEASKLAASKGKDTSGYDALSRKETSLKSKLP